MHLVSIGAYYILSGIAHYYLGHYQTSLQNINNAEPYLRALTDNVLNRLWYVFRYLNGLQFKDLNKDENDKLQSYFQQVEVWVGKGVLFKPYLTFMKAEKACSSNDFSQARGYYLDAIDSSHEQHYGILEAFIQQRLGELYLGQHHRHAAIYLQQALLSYQRCGADIKVRQMTVDYGIVIPEKLPDSNRNDISLNQLEDVRYLLKASRQINQELDFNKLLTTIMKAIMQRLGVQNGFLLIVENKRLNLFAKGEKKEDLTIRLKSQGSITSDTLCSAVANYVFRTEEQVLLNNACQEGDFISDEVVIEQQLKSIFCLPLLKQQQVLGVLYLENHLVPAVFTPEQIEQTQLLTAQAAIALENTLLIEAMKRNHVKIQQFNEALEHKVAERTVALNSVNEELKNFAYVVSHDLKAPLRAINQLSSWIEEDYADAFDDDGREQMALLRSRAKRMNDMIDGILQYSRIGRVKENREKVDMNALIDDVIDALAPPKHIKLEIQPHLPVLWGEKIRLYQVIQNLVDNAIKYNDKPQGLIQLSCVDETQHWCFCIKDNGVGIDAAYKEKVFKLFQTLSAKDQKDSTGIGLSLIEKIVNNWGGEIWLESTLAQGSQFYFTYPKNKRNTDE